MARHEQGASLVVSTSFEFSLKALEYQLSGPLLRQPLARHHLEHINSRPPLLENLQKTPKGAIGDGCGVLIERWNDRICSEGVFEFFLEEKTRLRNDPSSLALYLGRVWRGWLIVRL
jgi:hypothetical protein